MKPALKLARVSLQRGNPPTGVKLYFVFMVPLIYNTRPWPLKKHQERAPVSLRRGAPSQPGRARNTTHPQAESTAPFFTRARHGSPRCMTVLVAWHRFRPSSLQASEGPLQAAAWASSSAFRVRTLLPPPFAQTETGAPGAELQSSSRKFGMEFQTAPPLLLQWSLPGL